MAYTITSESYGRRLPKITATADSTDDLATLGTDFAEGSTVVIGDKTYSLDKVQGWIEPGSGGGGGIEVLQLPVTMTLDPGTQESIFSLETVTCKELFDELCAGKMATTIDQNAEDSYSEGFISGWQYYKVEDYEHPGEYITIYDFTQGYANFTGEANDHPKYAQG